MELPEEALGLLRVERHEPTIDASLEARETLSTHGACDDRARPTALRERGGEPRVEPLEGMAIDRDRAEPERTELLVERLERQDRFRIAVRLHLVAVDDEHERIERVRIRDEARLPDRTLV